jgi:acetyltransferase
MVTSYAEFFDAAKALSEQSIPRRNQPHGRNAVIVTTSGGAGTVASDQLSACGWTLPMLPDDIAEKVSAIAKQTEVGNPIDITGAFADKTMLPRLLQVLQRMGGVDAVFVVSGAGGALATGVAQEICDSVKSDGPELYVAWVGITPELEQLFDGSAISAYADPLRAIMASEASATFRQGQALRGAARRKLELLQTSRSNLQLKEGLLSAAETIAELVKAGISVAPCERVACLDAADVLPVAEHIGYPLVMKIDTPDLNHKSDSGGVRLGIGDAKHVDETLIEFRRISQEHRLRNAGVLVQAMLKGVEVFVGLKHEPGTGHLLVVGLGGTHAELHADSAESALLPTDDETLAGLIDRHRVLSVLVTGYRGEPACDRAALDQVISGLAKWASDCGPALREADFNPIIATPQGAYVVDARAVIATQGLDE